MGSIYDGLGGQISNTNTTQCDARIASGVLPWSILLLTTASHPNVVLPDEARLTIQLGFLENLSDDFSVRPRARGNCLNPRHAPEISRVPPFQPQSFCNTVSNSNKARSPLEWSMCCVLFVLFIKYHSRIYWEISTLLGFLLQFCGPSHSVPLDYHKFFPSRRSLC